MIEVVPDGEGLAVCVGLAEADELIEGVGLVDRALDGDAVAESVGSADGDAVSATGAITLADADADADSEAGSEPERAASPALDADGVVAGAVSVTGVLTGAGA